MASSFKKGITVLICSRNGKNNLPPTLKSIAAQQVNPGIPWEIIFIDNASTDDTKDVALNLWDAHHNFTPFRLYRRDIPGGKEEAVTLGIQKASYQYIIICDDDNWLKEDYVQLAYNIMSENDQIGLLGGFGIPVFENNQPPKWFDAFKLCYAVGEQSHTDGEVKSSLEMRFIWGAGSVLNKSVYETLINAGFQRVITEKNYPEMSRCEDMEMSGAIQLAGYKLWYDKRLVFHHFIAKEKLTWSYLIKIAKPGAMVRPYLLLYSALRVLNLDTEENDQFEAYRKIWKRYKRKYFFGMFVSILHPKDFIYSLRILLQKHSEGNHEYFVKMNKWYFFLGALRFSDREFKEIFTRLIQLKKNISPNY